MKEKRAERKTECRIHRRVRVRTDIVTKRAAEWKKIRRTKEVKEKAVSAPDSRAAALTTDCRISMRTDI